MHLYILCIVISLTLMTAVSLLKCSPVMRVTLEETGECEKVLSASLFNST